MNATNRAKLSVMFFLEYVIWGAWLPLLGLYMGDYLHFDGIQKAWVFNAFAIASLTGMFFGGQLADRYFSQEKYLSFSHLLGGIAMLGLIYPKQFWPFFGLMLLHCFFYVPTLSVTNAIAFANLKDAKEDFGFVRLWGTIGWIAASWPFIFIPIDWSRVPSVSAAGGFVLWLGKALSPDSLKTGPAMEAAWRRSTFTRLRRGVAGAGSLLPDPAEDAACREPGVEVRPVRGDKAPGRSQYPRPVHRHVLRLAGPLLLFLLDQHLLVENWLARQLDPACNEHRADHREIPAMAILGLLLKKYGWRWTMILGILGQGVRFGIYAIGTPELLWLVIASNLVHGFAYACFFATVYIFVDENFPQGRTHQRPRVYSTSLILGLGPFLGNFLWGWLGNVFTRTVDVGGKTVEVVEFHKIIPGPARFFAVRRRSASRLFPPGSKAGGGARGRYGSGVKFTLPWPARALKPIPPQAGIG